MTKVTNELLFYIAFNSKQIIYEPAVFNLFFIPYAFYCKTEYSTRKESIVSTGN